MQYSPASMPAMSDTASRSTRMLAPVDANRAEYTFGGGPVRSRTFSHDSIVGVGANVAVGCPVVGVADGPDVGLRTTP